MICPRCKSKVSNEDTVCPSCNLRLIFKCPRCSSPTRLGSVSCKKCGYTFVKFCPQCHSANYVTSSLCRKCSYEFDDSKEAEQTSIEQTETPIVQIEETENIFKPKEQSDNTLLVYIDFINLDRIFEKYDKEEFKQKVILNIKTTVRIVFSLECEFIDSKTVKFTLERNKTLRMADKINKFEEEFSKFNEILQRTLGCDLAYKFAIVTLKEAKKAEIIQLKLGADKDVIVSSNAYSKLNSELSLIKISADSYKMIFLEQKPVFEQKEDEKYDKALEIILSNLADNNSDVRLLSINAPRGAGKTHLLNDICSKLNKIDNRNLCFFYSQCSALTQISPWGLIQSFFKTYFEYENIAPCDFSLSEFEKRVLDKLKLEKIDPENLETLCNIIYPLKKDYFENILINKEITTKYLKDIFDCIKKNKNIVFIIDDFDLIDESSYDFLKQLVNEGYFENKAKMILSYKNQHSITMYFQSNKLNNTNCLNISLRKLNSSECKINIKKILGDNCEVPLEILTLISQSANGNITYIEQVLQYLFERKNLVFKDKIVKFKKDPEPEIPYNLEKCLFARLDFLKDNFEQEYIFLMTASLLGDKLDYKLLSQVFELDESGFFELVKKLEKRGYFKKDYNDSYCFKNSLTWSYCYIRSKEEKLIVDKALAVLTELNNRTISTPLICPILAQIIDNKELAFNLWTKNLQYASYIGDVNIYTMAQKQCLILLESVKLDNIDYIKSNICSRLGKLTYTKSPLEAKDYLTNAIVEAQKNDDINKIIDLSGYLVKSLYLVQDYTAVVEVVDNILKYFEINKKTDNKNSNELYNTLIKTKKLEALLNLGSWEEIASIVNSEINPVIQKHLTIFSKNSLVNQNEIFYSWISSNIILAQSYCEQGSPLAFELIEEINKVLSKEKGYKIDNLKVRLACVSAIANTSRGYFDESDAILQEILKDYSYVIDTPYFICKWNIVNIINKILKLDYASIKEELFEAASYADNCSDEVSKNLLKTLLAYVLLEEKNYLKALEIATSEMQYFSSKKIAFGALLSWYISAAATLKNKSDMYCIEICEKAVKICENAQNNNYYFKILFQELLALAYLKLNDKDNAQIYCDSALSSAYTNELLYLQVRLNRLKAQIAREKLSSQADDKKYDYAKNIIRMYNRTIEMAKGLNLSIYVEKIEKDLTSFKAHCQLNRIIEEKSKNGN